MTKEDAYKFAHAIATANGHPEPDAYAQAIAEAFEPPKPSAEKTNPYLG